MRKVFRIVLTGFVICVVVALSFAVVAFYSYLSLGETIKPYIKKAYRSMPLQISCMIPIPPEYGTLVFLRHGIHPSFLLGLKLANKDSSHLIQLKISAKEKIWSELD
ncbi:MAG TPA: hypothetical protein VEK32_05395 [Thermodesulfobacteriota bacterium]|nr:hypothetical protein [Thermodesulfobacteriota bacterium]